MELSRVILKPYITEKTNQLNYNNKQVATFLVDKKANKHLVEQAFIAIYNVKPEKINILIKKPSQFRTGTRVPGFTKTKKIAYVTLPQGIRIAITKEEIEEAKGTPIKDSEKQETKSKEVKKQAKETKKEKSTVKNKKETKK